MSICETGAGRRDPFYFGEDQAESVAGDEHRGSVHDVLARGPLVDVAGRVFGDARDRFGQSADERRDRIALGASFASYLLGIEAVHVAAGDDNLRGLLGDQTSPRLRYRKSSLGIEHSSKPGSSRDGLPELVRDENRPEQLSGHP